jgi:hypothetical protein
MALRFAIIKMIKTQVGEHWEDVVFEWDEDEVTRRFLENLELGLPDKKKPHFGERKWTETEVKTAFKEAWAKTVSDFKRQTIRIV